MLQKSANVGGPERGAFGVGGGGAGFGGGSGVWPMSGMQAGGFAGADMGGSKSEIWA